MRFRFPAATILFFLALASLALVGCTNEALYARLEFPPRPPSCGIGTAPFGSKVPPGYDVAAEIWAKNDEATTLEEVRERWQEKICKVGGDLLLGDRVYPSEADAFRYGHVLVLHRLSPEETKTPRKEAPSDCATRFVDETIACDLPRIFQNAPTFLVETVAKAREPSCRVETLGVGASIPHGYTVVGNLENLERAPLSGPSDVVERFRPIFCAAGGELLATETMFQPGTRYSPATLRIRSGVLLRRDPNVSPSRTGADL